MKYHKNKRFEYINNQNISISEINDDGVILHENKWRPNLYNINKIKEFIELMFKPINRNVNGHQLFYIENTSYHMKNWLDKDIDLIDNEYGKWFKMNISNGEFIFAMIESGYIARQKPDYCGFNVYFNVNPENYYNYIR